MKALNPFLSALFFFLLTRVGSLMNQHTWQSIICIYQSLKFFLYQLVPSRVSTARNGRGIQWYYAVFRCKTFFVRLPTSERVVDVRTRNALQQCWIGVLSSWGRNRFCPFFFVWFSRLTTIMTFQGCNVTWMTPSSGIDRDMKLSVDGLWYNFEKKNLKLWYFIDNPDLWIDFNP